MGINQIVGGGSSNWSKAWVTKHSLHTGCVEIYIEIAFNCNLFFPSSRTCHSLLPPIAF